jgi:hypothetical protein
MTLIFSNSHSDVQNCQFRALFFRFTANQAKIERGTSYSIINTLSGTFDQISDLEAKIQKTAPVHLTGLYRLERLFQKLISFNSFMEI